ncbi:hypothetical protein CC86DRAFT_431710 [Ophiobolus disseminans]|uniref:NACHT domain-containing protein n=1 Tax=Ophiobolus disseminans TaxID=1469910 RepID=A0A6A7AFV9_9PLEO|nr:hypothetical protein CC86DRAFT_431710 [Ophiobolus disseminans]
MALLEEAEVPYLVVDALDECLEEEQEQAIKGLQGITQAVPKTRILMASRREIEIEDLMASWCEAQLKVDEAGVNADIDTFVMHALATDKKLMRLPPATKKEIEEMFHEKSDGMFRWATLQLAEIRDVKIPRPENISRASRTMPRTLYGAYDRVLNTIEEQDSEDVRAALQWLAFSNRLLTIAQLAEACIIRLDSSNELYLGGCEYDALFGLVNLICSFIAIGEPLDL